MPKRSHHPRPAHTGASQGIVVSAIESVTNDCRDAIQCVISNRNLGFAREDLARHRIKCSLTGVGVSNAFARERYVVHELLEKGSTTYWLAISLYFQFRSGDYQLESISLVVFKGVRTDDTKAALLRAEWDCSTKPGLSKHAQPHWHIYSAVVNTDKDIGMSGFEDQLEIATFGATSDEDSEADEAQHEIQNFHFAMAAQWHLQEDALLEEQLNDVESLGRWIKGCIRYILGQLNYLPG